MHKFKLPIGDWSGDGHNQCDYFLVGSTKPVEEVREVHYQIVEKTGIDIHKICAEYEEGSIRDEDLITRLEGIGFKLKDHCESFAEDFGYEMTSKNMAELWIFLLMQVDPSLDLKILPENNLPMLAFYGFDEQKRHIGFVGYGVFYC